MNPQKKPYLRLPFFVLLSVVIGLGTYSYFVAKNTDTLWEGISSATGRYPVVASLVKVDNTLLAVPSWNMFNTQQPWLYVSKQKLLTTGYTPHKLVSVGVPHGDKDQVYQVSSQTAPSLRAMFKRAEEDGIRLMLSSAYRSAVEQKKLYDLYMTTRGQAYTVSYVAQPGQSEHQTGLAVDISTASKDCEKDSDLCSLDRDTVEWLAQNAPKFGFIQRYPSGKQSVTGMTNEEWHYRYVGVKLAVALTEADLTFDEFVQKTAPGYAK